MKLSDGTAPRLVALPMLLAIAALLLVASPGRAGGCTFVAAIDPDPGDPGSDSITAMVGEQITFWGTFIPGASVDLTFLHEGVPYGDFTPATADAEGDILFVFDFRDGQEGDWTVTAGVEATECAGTVDVTVTAAAGSPSASPSGMSNTATEERPTPRQAPESVLLTLAVLVVLSAGVTLLHRPR